MTERLQGIVTQIMYNAPVSGFTIARLMLDGTNETVVIKGKFASLQSGMTIVVDGEHRTHEKYGNEFQVTGYTEGTPVTTDGIEKYLGSGLIKGIGPITAKRIVAKFGAATLEVMESNMDWLAQVDGIGATKLEAIKTAWKTQRDIKQVMVFLSSYGISTNFAVKIYKKWGHAAIAQVKQNPYSLAQIRGVGFVSADAVARSMGTELDSPFRVEAGIDHVLSEATQKDGHCFLPGPKLVEKAVALLKLDKDGFQLNPNLVWQTLDAMVVGKKLITQESPKKPGLHAYYLPKFYYAEKGLAEGVKALVGNPITPDTNYVEKWMRQFMKSSGLPLSEEQQYAIKVAATERIAVLVGGPGCGKTHSAKAIIAFWESQGKTVALAAPTGRAAQRLSELTGKPASTLHRLLKYTEFGFTHGVDNPLTVDAILVDEVSMLDIFLARALVQSVDPDKTQLVLVGDRDQLSSVGAGMVLSDLMESKIVPVIRLTQVFRQAAESAIIRHAHTINQGLVPQMDRLTRDTITLPSDCLFIPSDTPDAGFKTIRRLIENHLPAWGFPESDVQILCPQVKGPVGTKNINKELQPIVNPAHPEKTEITVDDVVYRVGDRMIQAVNDYEREVFNGELGIIQSINLEDSEMVLRFPDAKEKKGYRDIKYERADWDDFYHATAISGHKAQGSQFEAIIIPLYMSNYVLLSRTWLYTSLTRAKRLAIVVGQPKAIGQAVRTIKDSKRCTYLRQRLQEVESLPSLALSFS